jgi:photosystem I subunit 3
MLMKKFLNLYSILFSLFFFLQPHLANAEYISLNRCQDSPTFQKRLISSVKKLENKLKYYKLETQEHAAILKQIEKTKNRFTNYQNLLCGKDGLPHIITTGELNHSNEFIIPGLLFLYITGWIGWSGRKYLKYAATTENSFENEIIINIPIAISIINSGFLWPIEAWKEFSNGDLLEINNNITHSPR